MATRRLELGFDSGTVLRLTVDESVSEALTAALGSGNGPAWRAIEAEEGTFWIAEKELLYVRLAPGEAPGRVGFGGS
jgi:hypothetical protein